MPTETPAPANPVASLKASLDGAKAQAARYIGARLALLRLEAAEAGGDAAARIRAGVVGVVCCFFAYLLLLAGLAGLVEHLRPGSWHLALLALALIHFAIGLPLLLKAARSTGKPWFQDSLAQLKEDEQWMRSIAPRPPAQPPKP